jgi:hypothetical protein
MAKERSTEEVLDGLFAQAVCLWGEEYAERLRGALRFTAGDIAAMTRHPLPPDLEPRFFT